MSSKILSNIRKQPLTQLTGLKRKKQNQMVFFLADAGKEVLTREARSQNKDYWEIGPQVWLTFRSLLSLGRLETDSKLMFIMLRNSRFSKSEERPTIFPSSERQLSRTSSFTYQQKHSEAVTAFPSQASPKVYQADIRLSDWHFTAACASEGPPTHLKEHPRS